MKTPRIALFALATIAGSSGLTLSACDSGSSAEPTAATTGDSGGGGSGAGGSGTGGQGAGGSTAEARFPFPQAWKSEHCSLAGNARSEDVIAAYELFKTTLLTADGAGGFLRVRRPNSSGAQVNSTVSEGIAYGMLLAVYMDDQEVFDKLFQYSQLWLDGYGLMHWYIDAEGTTPLGNGGATDSDEDIAWALIMADRQWGGQGALDKTYLELARHQIDLIWTYEVDHDGGEVLKPGDQWGGKELTNISYFAPAYYRVFGEVSGKVAEWNKVIDKCYEMIDLTLNDTNGNKSNGLVPAWSTAAGVPTHDPQHHQLDSCRTPFRIGQDYCYFGEPRARAYLEKITGFYKGVGIENITDGYALDGTPMPAKDVRLAAFVGPAGVGAMYDAGNQPFLDQAYADTATLDLIPEVQSIYYNTSWTALSVLMMSGNFVDFTHPPK